MRKKRIDKDIIVLLISTMVTVASWVGFEVYRAYTELNPNPEVEKHLTEIDPTLKVEVFSKLEEMNP